MMKNFTFSILFIGLVSGYNPAFTQNHIGFASGNYGGVSSLWFNPSSIVDSRHKFDINVVSINSYFDNNLFDVRRDAVLRQRFFKEPYNGNYNAVRADLLRLTPGMRNEPVNMYVDSKIQYPLSMMFSVGKKSAFAINLQSRAGMRAGNINRSTATLLYNTLQDSTQYGVVQNNNVIDFNYLRWQEAGFTYGTVLLNNKAHFLKGAFTGKWLMGQSAAHISSDNVRASFNSSNQLSLQSPLIKYYRTNNADVQSIDLNSFFRDIEDNQFGWDAGLTYEFRGKFKKFKYVGEDYEVKDRRDLNKYAFRLGVALLDVGKFNFRKQRHTNDHSANINNFDFSRVKANNFNEWDTAYSKLVQYNPNAPNSFEMSLPTAFSANLDVHLFRGFYLNAAMYAPVESITSKAQTNLRAVKWYAITPRIETRHFGLYIPVVATPLNNRTTVGATLRLGPVYVGSSNFGNYIFNDKLAAIDVHAGVKLGITYGRPSGILRKVTTLLTRRPVEEKVYPVEKMVYKDTSTLYAAYRKEIDSLRNVNLIASSRQDQKAPLVNVIVNNYLSGAPGVVAGTTTRADSVIVNNPVATPYAVKPTQIDTALQRKDAEINFLLRRIAETELRLQQLEQRLVADTIAAPTINDTIKQVPGRRPANNAPAPAANIQSPRATVNQPVVTSNNRQDPRVQQPASQVVQQRPVQQPITIIVQQPTPANQPKTRVVQRDVMQRNVPAEVTVQQPAVNNQQQLNRLNNENDKLEEQVRVLRAEMAAINNTTSAAVTNTVDTVTRLLRDTSIIVDTVRVRDTIRISDTVRINTTNERKLANATAVQPEYIPIYFATESSALSPAGIRVLERVVNDFTKSVSSYNIHLSGRTDSMGSAELNRQLAQRRINSVSRYLVQHGVPGDKIISETKPQLDGSPRPNAEDRRVDIEIISG